MRLCCGQDLKYGFTCAETNMNWEWHPSLETCNSWLSSNSRNSGNSYRMCAPGADPRAPGFVLLSSHEYIDAEFIYKFRISMLQLARRHTKLIFRKIGCKYRTTPNYAWAGASAHRAHLRDNWLQLHPLGTFSTTINYVWGIHAHINTQILVDFWCPALLVGKRQRFTVNWCGAQK